MTLLFGPSSHSNFGVSLASLLLTALVATAVGCSGSSEPPPDDVYPVSGTVTFNGRPVAGATVTFVSQSKSRAAFGMTDDDGVYHLTTFTVGDGAVEGAHNVTVTKTVDAAGSGGVGADMESEDYDPTNIQTDADPNAGDAALLPPKYANKATSGLTATVTADGDNVHDLDL